MQNVIILSLEEKQSLLSTFDGCSVDLNLNNKQLFDTDDLTLFVKHDALYIEQSNKLTKQSESTRLIILFENIDTITIENDNLQIVTNNKTIFNLLIAKSANLF